jgi:hypothetical protein
MKLLSILLATACGVFAASTGVAMASAPVPIPFHSGPDVVTVCGYPQIHEYDGTVWVSQLENGVTKVRFDVVGTLSANGKVLTDLNHFTEFDYPDGTFRWVGLISHVVVRGEGPVLIDAGVIRFDETGNVDSFNGRMDQLTDLTPFCEALAG